MVAVRTTPASSWRLTASVPGAKQSTGMRKASMVGVTAHTSAANDWPPRRTVTWLPSGLVGALAAATLGFSPAHVLARARPGGDDRGEHGRAGARARGRTRVHAGSRHDAYVGIRRRHGPARRLARTLLPLVALGGDDETSDGVLQVEPRLLGEVVRVERERVAAGRGRGAEVRGGQRAARGRALAHHGAEARGKRRTAGDAAARHRAAVGVVGARARRAVGDADERRVRSAAGAGQAIAMVAGERRAAQHGLGAAARVRVDALDDGAGRAVVDDE